MGGAIKFAIKCATKVVMKFAMKCGIKIEARAWRF